MIDSVCELTEIVDAFKKLEHSTQFGKVVVAMPAAKQRSSNGATGNALRSKL